jgi:hypothetical protein
VGYRCAGKRSTYEQETEPARCRGALVQRLQEPIAVIMIFEADDSEPVFLAAQGVLTQPLIFCRCVRGVERQQTDAKQRYWARLGHHHADNGRLDGYR